MKNLTFIFIFFLVVPGLRTKAQEHQEGIFLSSADFNNNKISYSNPDGKKYKFYLHNSFNTPIRIITGDSVKTISKKSVFGYRDEKGTCYRYYDKSSFEILNPSESILLYKKTSVESTFRNIRLVTRYYFSCNASSPLYDLTIWNLKLAFFQDVYFEELINYFFSCDDQLTTWDRAHKQYFLNCVYDISKQKLSRTIREYHDFTSKCHIYDASDLFGQDECPENNSE